MLSRTRLRSVLSVFGIVSTVILLGAGCNGCNHEEMVPPKKEVPTYTQKDVIDPVVWPDPSTINKAALAAMKPEERAKIALSGVPVLVPNDPKFLVAGILGEPNEFGYDFGLPDSIDDVGFTIGASHVTAVTDAPQPPQSYKPDPNAVMIRGHRVSISQNEVGNWIATWGESGSGYLLHIGCDNFSDPHCADDTYIKSFVASLVYVGGSGK